MRNRRSGPSSADDRPVASAAETPTNPLNLLSDLNALIGNFYLPGTVGAARC